MAESRQVVTFLHGYKHVTEDTLVKDGAGFLYTVTVNACGTAGTLTLYDNNEELDDVIAAIAIPLNPVPFSLHYVVKLINGLYLGFDGVLAADITVSYR